MSTTVYDRVPFLQIACINSPTATPSSSLTWSITAGPMTKKRTDDLTTKVRLIIAASTVGGGGSGGGAGGASEQEQFPTLASASTRPPSPPPPTTHAAEEDENKLWRCQECTFENKSQHLSCEVCTKERGANPEWVVEGAEEEVEATGVMSAGEQQLRELFAARFLTTGESAKLTLFTTNFHRPPRIAHYPSPTTPQMRTPAPSLWKTPYRRY